MNPHYTGYELELNQSRQATIRAEFESQARSRSLNETPSTEGQFQLHNQSGKVSKVRLALFLSLFGAPPLVLAYFTLIPSHPAAAGLKKSEPSSYSVSQPGTVNQVKTSSFCERNRFFTGWQLHRQGGSKGYTGPAPL